MEGKIKHLELIQGAIARMAGNSFLLRGWIATVVAGLYALSIENLNHSHLVFSLIVTASFALLDSYYLSKERAFRKLYDEVRKKNADNVDFSMNIDHLDSLCGWLRATKSITILLFYGTLVIAQILFVNSIL